VLILAWLVWRFVFWSSLTARGSRPAAAPAPARPLHAPWTSVGVPMRDTPNPSLARVSAVLLHRGTRAEFRVSLSDSAAAPEAPDAGAVAPA